MVWIGSSKDDDLTPVPTDSKPEPVSV
jgi:hypothetical protein